jgi:hypothetical protein
LRTPMRRWLTWSFFWWVLLVWGSKICMSRKHSFLSDGWSQGFLSCLAMCHPKTSFQCHKPVMQNVWSHALSPPEKTCPFIKGAPPMLSKSGVENTITSKDPNGSFPWTPNNYNFKFKI